MIRRLNIPHLLNIRDLGGYPTIDGRETRWCSLFRSDDLSRLDPESYHALHDYGIRTVLDLRWPDEARSRPSIFQKRETGIDYVNVPILGDSREAWGLFRTPATKETWNCFVIQYPLNRIADTLRAIIHTREGGVLFHCKSGKDRTGFLAALLLALADVEPAIIAYDYGLTTDNLREAYLRARPDAGEAVLERVRCPPERVYQMLSYINTRHASVGAYLTSIGLAPEEIGRLRSTLR